MSKKKYIFEELVGKKVGRLTPESISEIRYSSGEIQWNFKCDCGNIYTAPPSFVYYKNVKSCGCYKKENANKNINKQKLMDSKKKRSIEYAKSFIGKRNNKLTVIDYCFDESGTMVKLVCKCDCGNEKSFYPHIFTSGAIKSCGCLRRETRENFHCVKHGYAYDSLYRKFLCMKRRCYWENDPHYNYYGGRGITICDEWLDNPGNFVEWAVETKPKDGKYSLDRIDNDGPYAPWNCRWVTMKEQSRNKRSTRIIEYNGEKKCLSDWAKEFNMSDETLRCRLKRGWSVERALTEPINERCRHKNLDKLTESN